MDRTELLIRTLYAARKAKADGFLNTSEVFEKIADSILYEVAPQVKGESKSPLEAYSEIDPVTRRHQSKGACE